MPKMGIVPKRLGDLPLPNLLHSPPAAFRVDVPRLASKWSSVRLQHVAGNPPAEKPAFLLDSRILRPQSPRLERVRLCPSSLHFAAVLGTFKSVDAASLGAGLRLGWLNAITADLSIAQVAQGQGLLGTGAVPELLQTGPRKNTRFFFILTARL
jgi:hypothetical protein